MILLIDNYDSFAHNLARYFEMLGQRAHVVRNDNIRSEQVAEFPVSAIVISPGPGSPLSSGASLRIVKQWHRELPILGVCLGHQTIVEALGGVIHRSDHPLHGSASDVTHDGLAEFEGLPNPFQAGRYHSLIADSATLPTELTATAHTSDGTIMAVRHAEFPVVGWQFHPESILTPVGLELLRGFLRVAGISAAGERRFADEYPERRRDSRARGVLESSWPERPVTF